MFGNHLQNNKMIIEKSCGPIVVRVCHRWRFAGGLDKLSLLPARMRELKGREGDV